MDHDDGGDIFGVLAGTGVFIIQVCVLVPGLLACLLLVVALTVPLLLPLVPLALLAALFYGLRAIARAGRGGIRRLRSGRRPRARVGDTAALAHPPAGLLDEVAQYPPMLGRE
jgi:cobalamin biosynthesis protein CobD/CbiB